MHQGCVKLNPHCKATSTYTHTQHIYLHVLLQWKRTLAWVNFSLGSTGTSFWVSDAYEVQGVQHVWVRVKHA